MFLACRSVAKVASAGTSLMDCAVAPASFGSTARKSARRRSWGLLLLSMSLFHRSPGTL